MQAHGVCLLELPCLRSVGQHKLVFVVPPPYLSVAMLVTPCLHFLRTDLVTHSANVTTEVIRELTTLDRILCSCLQRTEARVLLPPPPWSYAIEDNVRATSFLTSKEQARFTFVNHTTLEELCTQLPLLKLQSALEDDITAKVHRVAAIDLRAQRQDLTLLALLQGFRRSVVNSGA